MSNNYQMEYYVRSKDINNKLGLSVSSASPYFLNAIKDNEEFKNVEIKDIHITHNNPLFDTVNVKILTDYVKDGSKITFNQVLMHDDMIICESTSTGYYNS